MMLVLAPVMLLTYAAVRFLLGAPVFFTQRRCGHAGADFRIVKFRSMHDARDASGLLLADELRMPPLGRLIRRFRIDETPSLVAVLRGEMAMVGPRPLPADYAECRLGGAARASVRPGLTGLAQVSGNTLLAPEEKVALDLHYIASRSTLGDLAILLRTGVTLVRGERRDEPMIARALARMAGGRP